MYVQLYRQLTKQNKTSEVHHASAQEKKNKIQLIKSTKIEILIRLT